MSRKSRRQKKRFSCGHVGFGKYCHLCKQKKEGYDFSKDRGEKRNGGQPQKSGGSKPKFSRGDIVSFGGRKGTIMGSRVKRGRVVYDISEPDGKQHWDIPESAVVTGSDEPAGGPNGSKISKMEVRPAREVFGENAFSPDRPVVVIWTENGARLPLMVPLGARYVREQWDVFNPKAYDRSVSYKGSNFGAFVKKYGSKPRIGLPVETRIDERGYLVIDVRGA